MPQLNRVYPKKILLLIFVLELFYGSLILMINYTQTGLCVVIFGNFHHSAEMVFSIVGQPIGSVVAILIIRKLLAKFNTRYIFAACFTIGLIATLLLSQFDALINLSVLDKRIILFFLLFLLGLGIAPIDPLLTTLIAAIYHGNKCSKNLQYLESIYVFGASIIPIFATPFIISLDNKGFNEVRDFYYIAAAVCVIGIMFGLFINFIHNKQLVTGKILNKENYQGPINLWNKLIWMVLMMLCFVIIETTLNYAFKNLSINNLVNQTELNATMAYGIYLLVQGLTLISYAKFLYKKITPFQFIIADCLIIYLSLLAIINGSLITTVGLFLTAIFLGIGISNLWAMIYSWAVSIDEKRATFIGISMNVTTSIMIIFTELSMGSIWRLGQNSSNIVLYYLIAIICMVILIFIVIFACTYWFKEKKLKSY